MMLGIIAWLGETAIGAVLKGFWSRLFPSTEERLGKAEQEVKDESAIIQTCKDRQSADQAVVTMSDAAVSDELRRKWTASD